MNKNLWPKTLLQLYRKYKREIERMDIQTDKLADKGFDHSMDTMAYLELFRKVVLRKKHCQYAKQLVEKYALNKKLEESVLYWRYVRGKQFHDVAEIMDKQIRQVFRQHDKELDLFALRLKLQGITDEVLDREFSTDVLFRKQYKSICLRDVNYCKQEVHKVNLRAADGGIAQQNHCNIQ